MRKRGVIETAIYAAVIIILLLLPPLGLSTFYIHILIGVFIYIIVVSSLRLINLSGQASLGHAGLMSIGAYTSAILAKNLGWTPWLTMPIGGLFTLAIALLVAIPFTRVRGIYFAMISLFFGIAVLAMNQVFDSFTGGYSGMGAIPSLLGSPKVPYYYFFLALLVICLLIMHRLEFSRIGLTWRAVAQSYSVASSIGINDAGQRILCFGIGGFFAGLAGAGYAHYYLQLSHETFSFLQSMYLFVYMMIGGVNSFAGPMIGTAIMIIIPEIFRNLKEYVPFIFAGIMLIVIFVMPQGLAGLPEQFISLIKNFRKEKETSQEKNTIKHA